MFYFYCANINRTTLYPDTHDLNFKISQPRITIQDAMLGFVSRYIYKIDIKPVSFKYFAIILLVIFNLIIFCGMFFFLLLSILLLCNFPIKIMVTIFRSPLLVGKMQYTKRDIMSSLKSSLLMTLLFFVIFFMLNLLPFIIVKKTYYKKLLLIELKFIQDYPSQAFFFRVDKLRTSNLNEKKNIITEAWIKMTINIETNHTPNDILSPLNKDINKLQNKISNTIISNLKNTSDLLNNRSKNLKKKILTQEQYNILLQQLENLKSKAQEYRNLYNQEGIFNNYVKKFNENLIQVQVSTFKINTKVIYLIKIKTKPDCNILKITPRIINNNLIFIVNIFNNKLNITQNYVFIDNGSFISDSNIVKKFSND